MAKFTFNATLICYLVASLEYIVYLVYRRPIVSTLAIFTLGAGALFHTMIMGLRASQTGHGPYTTSFEVAIFFSWVLVMVYFLTEWKYKIKDLGAFVIPLVFLILLYSAFLSKDAGLAATTQPQVWLTLHRTLSVLGYAAFGIAFAVAIMYLIQERQVKTKKLGIMYFRMPSLEVLDNLNHKVIAVGFPLFTIGFLTGSIWKSQMDEAFFSWSLLKTWPLVIVWVIYGLLFFGRIIVGLRGKKAAQGSIVGFMCVILTYFLHV